MGMVAGWLSGVIPYLCEYSNDRKMRRIFLVAFSALALSITGCSEDFEVAAPYKDITLVYAMLDHGKTDHYIRIQKAFMDDQKSSIDMAKLPDSSYYADGVLDVRIEELLPNGTVSGSDVLTRVNMADEGVTKDPGIFFTAPNYAYKYVKQLNKNNRYRIVIKNTITGDIDSSSTAIISSDTTQGNFYVLAFGDYNLAPFSIAFSRTTAVSHRYRLPVNIKTPAKTLEGIIRFAYWERDGMNPDVRKTVDFPFATAVVVNNSAELSVPNSAFYDFFREKLGVAAPNLQRFLDSNCQIFVYAGSEDFYDYQQITAAQLGGLTSNEIKPIYTNLKGSDVYGLFSTRALRYAPVIPIEALTYDSLAANPKTQPTGLQPEPYRP
jgi:hypothetical protein